MIPTIRTLLIVTLCAVQAPLFSASAAPRASHTAPHTSGLDSLKVDSIESLIKAINRLVPVMDFVDKTDVLNKIATQPIDNIGQIINEIAGSYSPGRPVRAVISSQRESLVALLTANYDLICRTMKK